MAGVHIVCDSTADFDSAYLAAHRLRVVPLKVIFGSEVLADGIDIRPAAFYQRMRTSSVHPRTSQPTPAEFEAVFRELGEGGDAVLCTTISAELSGTYASAVQARAALPGQDIRIVDSRSASIGHQAQARAAMSVAEAGGGPDEVEAAVAAVAATLRVLFTVETLEYLRRGGRIGGARALLGSMLDIKPILEVREGVIEPVGRVRTYPRALSTLADHVREAASGWGGAVLLLAHADKREVALELAAELAPAIGRKPLVEDVGPVIGCHSGPGAIGLAFHKPLP
jgi:DegV family protein with EDD domain